MVPVRRNARHWLAYLAGGGLVLLSILSNSQREKVNSGGSGDKQVQDITVNTGQKRPEPPSKRYRHYKHASEEEHRTAEQFNWRHGFVLNVGIAIAAAATVALSMGTYLATKDQAKSARTANRAWVRVEIEPASLSLTWHDHVPQLQGRITATNEGNSPAIDVQVFGKLFVLGSSDLKSDRILTENLCRGLPFAGNILFMKDQITSTRFVPVITRVTLPKPMPKGVIPFPIGVAVCGVYSIVGDTDLHSIARVYHVGVGDPDRVPNLDETILAPGIALGREIDGEYAN